MLASLSFASSADLISLPSLSSFKKKKIPGEKGLAQGFGSRESLAEYYVHI